MADHILLNCTILGPDVKLISSVVISRSRNVDQLRDAIKAKRATRLAHIDTAELVIWKLPNPISGDDIDKELGGVVDGAKIPDALRLEPMEELSHYFPEAPGGGKLHLAIQVPLAVSTITPSSSDSSSISGPNYSTAWSPRRKTVQVLYQKLGEEKLIHVRGTPASGKTTLLHLLWAHVRKEEPGVEIECIVGWEQDSDAKLGIAKRLPLRISGYPAKTKTYLLWDNAECTYWDVPLWEYFFKSYRDYDNYRIVLFCSYGSAGSHPLSYKDGTPMSLHPTKRVSLLPDEESTDEFGTIGLLLTRDEFDDVIRRLPQHALAPDLQNHIFLWTRGHVGAVADILMIISKAAKKARRENELLDLDSFTQLFSLEKFWEKLTPGGWARGLPGSELQELEVANLFRHLLQYGSMKQTPIPDIANYCHKMGWIYASMVTQDKAVYVLPSPIHRSYLEWKLLPSSTPIPFATPLDLSISAIQAFQPSQLSHPPRRVGDAGSVRPPEAAYQDEFYRSVFKATQGCVRFSPEYSSAARRGRIDFFIPSTKWGIELVRDGSNLEEHSSCFYFTGAYGAWLKSDDMKDYIILDFRNTRPQKPHNHIKNLYHVVFLNRHFNAVEILNNNLEKVQEFGLVEH